MSVSVHAILLIRLQAWYGQWLTVADLAAHLAVRPEVVRQHLQPMAEAGTVALRHGADGLIEAACIGPASGEPVAEPPAAPAPPGICGAVIDELAFWHLPPHPYASERLDAPSIASPAHP